MRTIVRVSALLLAATGGAAASDARASGPIDFEIAAKAGVGTAPGGGAPNPLGFGLGARAGLQIIGLYGGVAIMNYFGESQTFAPYSVSSHALLYGVEGGFGQKFGPLTLRAQLGVGNYGESIDVSPPPGPPMCSLCIVPSAGTRNSLYVEPGVMAMLALGKFIVGADANVLVLPSRTNATNSSSFDAAFTLHGQAGLKF